MNPCVLPKPGVSNPADGNRWMHIHNRFISETKDREPDVVFIGDSIFSQLEQRSVWREIFVPMHPLNFSIIGDQIQQVLWRIQNGELDNIKPKVVVLYTGEFNLRSSSPQVVVEGLVQVVKSVTEKQPEARVLVQEILPRGLNPNPLRDSTDKFNMLVKNALKDVDCCKVVPVGEGIVRPDGTISHIDLYDWYYPTNEGYLKAFSPLINELKSLLQDSNV